VLRAIKASLLAALFVGLCSGIALAASQQVDLQNEDAPQRVIQVSLSAQPDLCLGHVTVSLSTDGGRHWRAFMQSSIRGNPAKCAAEKVTAPSFDQASVTWTAFPGGEEQGAVPGIDPGDLTGGTNGDAKRDPTSESQVVTLSESPEKGGTSKATLATTTGSGHRGAQTYWARVTWCARCGPGDHDQIKLAYGSN
jgi:hypothetical protein